MGLYLRAELTQLTDGEVTYWVHDGLDYEQGETMVIPLDDFNKAYTVGCDHLKRWSSSMVGKIFHAQQEAGQWPIKVQLASG